MADSDFSEEEEGASGSDSDHGEAQDQNPIAHQPVPLVPQVQPQQPPHTIPNRTSDKLIWQQP